MLLKYLSKDKKKQWDMFVETKQNIRIDKDEKVLAD